MASINFDESVVAEMKQFYLEEFIKTLSKLKHIKKVLDQLGDKQTSIEINVGQIPLGVVAPAKNTSQTEFLDNNSGISKPTRKRKSKSGPKSIWEPLIMKRMRQLNRPLSYDELAQEIMVFAKIPEAKKASVKQAITNVIFRLRNRDKKLDTFSLGSREKYIALKSWFDESGDIKKEYKQYLPKKTIKRRPLKQ